MHRYPATASAMPALVLCAVLAGCGRPSPPDISGELSRSVQTLGASAFYPFRELPRIGSVYLVDENNRDTHLMATDRSRTLLTEELVPAFEERFRARRMVIAAGRFPASPSDLDAKLLPAAGSGNIFYRQPQAPTTPPGEPASGGGNLPLAAFPGYTLASIDQSALSAGLPTAWANFLGGFGLRRTSFLRMEAAGVEYADLPLDAALQAIGRACDQYGGYFGQGGTGPAADQLMIRGLQKLEAYAGDRPVQPRLAVVTRIYYLRGVRFIIDDSRAAAAILQATLQNRLPAGVTAPAITNVTVQPAGGQGSGGSGGGSGGGTPSTAASASLSAKVDELNTTIQALRSAVASQTNAGLAGMAAHATARGVELVQAFERPLAFGYDAIWTGRGTIQVDQPDGRITRTNGLNTLCQVGAMPPPPLPMPAAAPAAAPAARRR